MTPFRMFHNPRTGETKRVKVGWSWTLLLFASVFGLPLFLRRLYVWGFFMFALSIANWFIPDVAALVSCLVLQLGLSIWFAIKGNEMTARNLLDQGWELTS